MAIGIATAIPFGSGLDWIAYWASQDEVLFFAETENIADGKLYNQKSGATDYLTVTGAAGSYTFECPDNATYIAADSDRLWFLPSTTQLTVTEANLIAYDFTRTIVKYDSATPYALSAIMILSSDISAGKVDRLHTDFELSLYWSGVLNDNGVLKDNKPATERYLWNLPKTITGLVAWYSGKVPEAFDLTGTLINQMEDLSENLNHLAAVAADATRPVYDSVNKKLVFTAANVTRLRKTPLVISLPFTKFIVWKKNGVRDIGAYLSSGASTASGLVGTGTSGTGNFVMNNGSLMNWGDNDVTTVHVHICEFNGALSNYWIDDGAPTSGNTGSNNIGGMELGSYNNGVAPIDADWYEEICYSGVLNSANRTIIKEFLQANWGL